METKITNTVRTQKTVSELKSNLKSTLSDIKKVVDEKDWIVTTNGIQLPSSALTSIMALLKPSSIKCEFNGNMSLNSRKNVAKRVWNVQRKPGKRSFNALFYVLYKLEILSKPIKIELSKKEQEIQRKRKIYVKLRKEAEEARLEYVKEKGDFYKK